MSNFYVNQQVLDVDTNGICYGTKLVNATLEINCIPHLEDRLKALEDENAQLKEWLSYGKYSAK